MAIITADPQTLCKFERTLQAIETHEAYDDNDKRRINLYRNRHLPAAAIGRELRTAGYTISNTRIKEHFTGDCNCRIDL